jgi:hypothetical protein
MKTIVNSILVTIIVIVSACTKDKMMVGDVNVGKYESYLDADYSGALLYHNTLSVNAVPSDSIYNKTMYHRNDSLFSEHFYEFCIDMMQNSGMMGTSNNMMGNHGGMMGPSGSMMNGTNMGGSADTQDMMHFMDSLHLSSSQNQHTDYMKLDSLMYYQMTMCKMMVSTTSAITNSFDKMQALRKVHRSRYGI